MKNIKNISDYIIQDQIEHFKIVSYLKQDPNFKLEKFKVLRQLDYDYRYSLTSQFFLYIGHHIKTNKIYILNKQMTYDIHENTSTYHLRDGNFDIYELLESSDDLLITKPLRLYNSENFLSVPIATKFMTEVKFKIIDMSLNEFMNDISQ